MVALDAQNSSVKWLWQKAKTNTRAGCIGLAVSAGVNHAFRCAADGERGFFQRDGRADLPVGLDARQRVPTKTQLAIRGVFEQINRMSGEPLESLQNFQRTSLFGERSRHTGRILKIGDEVNRLHAAEFAGFFQPLQNGFEVCQVNSVTVQFHAARADALALQDAQKDKIRRVFDENDVAFVTERFERHVKQLLRAAGDHHASGRVRMVVVAVKFLQMASGQFAQVGFAGGDAVLERGPAGFGRMQNFVEQLA